MKTISLSDINIFEIGSEIQMVGAVFEDKDNTYLCMCPERPLKEVSLLQMSLDEWKRFLRQTDLLERQIKENAGPFGVTKAIVRKSQRRIDSYMKWKVFARDNYTCRYCGVTGIPLTIDHLILWEEGGPTIPENLITACKSCNRTRGCQQYKDWLESETYKKKSKGLTEETIKANKELINTLDSFPRTSNTQVR